LAAGGNKIYTCEESDGLIWPGVAISVSGVTNMGDRGAVDLLEVSQPAAVESLVKTTPRNKASALGGRHADVAAIEEQDANEAIAASNSLLTGIEQSINHFAPILVLECPEPYLPWKTVPPGCRARIWAF